MRVIGSCCGDVAEKLGLKKAKVGVEKGLEVVGTTYRHAEPIVPAAPWFEMLDDVFADAELVDITDLMQTAKLVKSAYDLERLRVANEIAHMGASKFLKDLEPGMREVEASALIEGTIRAEGAGYKGARLVWAEAEVASGPVNTAKANLLIPSTDRVIEEGRPGYGGNGHRDGWLLLRSDLHGCRRLEPDDRQREVHNAVLAAQQAAAAAMKPGKFLC